MSEIVEAIRVALADKGLSLDSAQLWVSGVILAALAAIFYKRLLALLEFIIDSFVAGLKKLVSRPKAVEIDKVFPSRRSAEDFIGKDITQSAFVFAYIGRGNYLQREIVNRIDVNATPKMLRILIPTFEPPKESAEPNWTEINEQELAKIDPLYGQGALADQISNTKEYLGIYAKKGLLEYRQINTPHFGRLLITDSYAYLTPYHDRKPSADNPTVAFAKRDDGIMYDHYLRLFSLLWDQARHEA